MCASWTPTWPPRKPPYPAMQPGASVVGLLSGKRAQEVSAVQSLGTGSPPSATVAAWSASCGSGACQQASLKALGWFPWLSACSGAAVHCACVILDSVLSSLSGVALSPHAVEDC